MPSAQKTPLLQLNLWQSTDRPMMNDFRSDNEKIDDYLQNLEVEITPGKVAIGDETGKLAASVVSAAELAYLQGVTGGVQAALDGKAPTSHTHAIANVTGLQAALDGKAPTSHTHAIANVTGLQAALDGKAPTSHTHAIANVTDLQTALDGKAPSLHTHGMGDVNGLQTALAGKAAAAHGHAIGDVSGLQMALDSKAGTSHSHAISDVTNLQTVLDGKAPSSHTHAIANVTGLQVALEGKAAAMHTHGMGDVTGLNAQLGMRAITEINILGRALCSSSWGTIIETPATYGDLVNLAGTTGNVQSQINGKLNANARAADTTKIVGRDLFIYPSDPGGVDGDIWIQI